MAYTNTNDCKVLKFFILKLKQVAFKKGEVSIPEKEEQKTKEKAEFKNEVEE